MIRHTFGPVQMRKALAAGTMRAGVPTAQSSVPAPNADPAAEVAAVAGLREAADRFLAHAGPYPPNPVFGKATPDQTRRLHAIHCAHHLGFLAPRGGTD